MTDSSSFSSLFALVDSHLSKCNLNDTSSEDGRIGSLPIPMLNIQRGLSDTRLTSPPQRLPIPSFSLSESPITNVLSNQISNMIKAKELKKQQEQEQERIQEMKKLRLEEDNCVIDLMKAVQKPLQPYTAEPQREPILSSSSSFESLVLDYKAFTNSPIATTSDVLVPPPEPEPMLPITTDMSYILKQKIKSGKCSAFGKVLTSRLRPVAAPYLREKIDSNIVPFDFKTKSPCDLIKEKLKRKPTHSISNTYHDFF